MLNLIESLRDLKRKIGKNDDLKVKIEENNYIYTGLEEGLTELDKILITYSFILPLEIKEIIFINIIESYLNNTMNKDYFIHGINTLRTYHSYFYNLINKHFKYIELDNLKETHFYKIINEFDKEYNFSKITKNTYVNCHSLIKELSFNDISFYTYKSPIQIFIHHPNFKNRLDILEKGGIIQNINIENEKIIHLNFPNGLGSNIHLYFYSCVKFKELLRKTQISSSISGLYLKYGENKIRTLFYISEKNKFNHFLNSQYRDNKIILNNYINFKKIYKNNINLLNEKDILEYCFKYIKNKHNLFNNILVDFLNKNGKSLYYLDDDEETLQIDFKYKKKNLLINVFKIYGTYIFTFKEKLKTKSNKMFKIECNYKHRSLTNKETLYMFNYRKFDCFKYKIINKYLEKLILDISILNQYTIKV